MVPKSYNVTLTFLFIYVVVIMYTIYSVSLIRFDTRTGKQDIGKFTKCHVMLRLHYVPGGHGNHVSGHRGRNGIDVTQRGGPYGQT